MPTYQRHVLFVDDDTSLQQVIKHLFEQHGVDVTTANDGKTAYQLMKDGLHPDIIIADLEMPQMNGLQLFRAIRAHEEWTAIPFIVLSAHADRSAMRQAMIAGVDDFLTKPLDNERLLLTIYGKTKRTQELTKYAEAIHETLDYIRRDMARMFTHELRTPLVSLNMVIELLKSHRHDLSEADMEELLEAMQSGVTRLNRLVEQMVLLIQTDTTELHQTIEAARTKGPLWEALLAAVSKAREFSVRQRDIEIIYDDGGVKGEILAEWRSLRHALAEILSNAMAFSPKDKPIRVIQRREKNTITLTVIDEGPGIPEERQGDLFRRFNQVERELHDQQGIGMGLYLAKTIIEATGGTLDIESAEGKGTTVRVSFPIA
ncbi:MAG: hypothetical protein Kow0077_16040 [Anaerolineae bacterium]